MTCTNGLLTPGTLCHCLKRNDVPLWASYARKVPSLFVEEGRALIGFSRQKGSVAVRRGRTCPNRLLTPETRRHCLWRNTLYEWASPHQIYCVTVSEGTPCPNEPSTPDTSRGGQLSEKCHIIMADNR